MGWLDHQDSEILLGCEHLERTLVVRRRDDHFGKDAGDLAGHLHTDRPIGRDHPAVRRDRIAGVGFAMGLGDVRSEGNAAWVGMFDDRDGGLVEVAGGPPRGVRINVIVVGHLFAVQLLSVRESPSRTRNAIQGRRLVRVFPVPQTGDLLPGPSHPTRKARTVAQVSDDVAHPARHRYVVRGGMHKGCGRKRLPLGQRKAARHQGLQELRILLRRGDHSHRCMIFC